MFVRELLDKFLPKDKHVLLFDTTDGAANMIKLSRLLGHERVTCVAHSLHNLLITDTLTKIPEAQAFISQCKDIVNALRFKAHLIDAFVLEQKEADIYMPRFETCRMKLTQIPMIQLMKWMMHRMGSWELRNQNRAHRDTQNTKDHSANTLEQCPQHDQKPRQFVDRSQ